MNIKVKTVINHSAESSDAEVNSLMEKGYLIAASCITPIPGVIDSQPSFIYVFTMQQVFVAPVNTEDDVSKKDEEE